jgi:hypothetical protein
MMVLDLIIYVLLHANLKLCFLCFPAFFLMDENKFAYAQDDLSNESPSENAKGQEENQEAHVSDLQRVEDGTVVSNEHTIKWRLFTDSGRDLFSKVSTPFPSLPRK